MMASPKNKPNVFGLRLRVLRQKKELTQQQLADLVGVAQQTLQAWEVGRQYPRNFWHLRNLANVFGMTIDEITDPNHHNLFD